MSKDLFDFVRANDFVEYFLFPTSKNEDEKELENLLKELNKIVENYSANYLWHKDGFNLRVRSSANNILLETHTQESKKEQLSSHLYGITYYGDNIEDEWFIVYLLQQITKHVTSLVARVIDSDGEFLLIEAANYLPLWANPDTCENRVYIYNGLLHLISPQNLEEEEEEEEILVKDAINILFNNRQATLASSDIQNCIQNKVNGYPDKINENLHHSTVYLPIGIAAILKHKPNLIAPAVLAFCNRDTLDSTVCRAMKYFPPENRVYTNVTFTKCLYAMLMHSMYLPDRKTGWNLPATNSTKFKSHSLGVKIACGFEILASQAKSSSDIDNDKSWLAYLKNLRSKNYFKDLIENSKEYNDLLNKAKEYFISNQDSMQYGLSVGQEILNLTKNLDYDLDELKEEQKSLPDDDDESWLNITPEELDQMLRERYGQKNFFSVNCNSDASNFTEKVNQFLNHISDVNGVEFPADEHPIRPQRGIKTKSKVSFSADIKTKEQENKINFDPNAFSCAVQNILNFVIPEDDSWDLESESDMSDYGSETAMQLYMEQMDKELAKTTIGESFEKKEESFEDIESFKPVDIDMNALKNILESYKSQMGEAGPSSNMLGPMGLHLDATDSENK